MKILAFIIKHKAWKNGKLADLAAKATEGIIDMSLVDNDFKILMGWEKLNSIKFSEFGAVTYCYSKE